MMGLDWTLLPKPKEGFEEEFNAILARLDARDSSEELLERFYEISVSPEETLGCPRIGIDEEATKYFLEKIVSSHREDPDHTPYWDQSDEDLVKDNYGKFVPDLIEYDKSTFTAFGPFRALAGYFSFRGKVVANSPLLPQTLRNLAYTRMDPERMREYARKIENAAILNFSLTRNVDDPRAALQEKVREYIEQKRKLLEELDGVTLESDQEVWEYPIFFRHSEEYDEKLGWFDEWMQLKAVLDAAEWLRFWADKGHTMEPWY